MTHLDDSYLDYPKRGYGMDHQRYQWSMMAKRQPIHWPHNKKLALWVNVGLQFFPLNQKGIPFKVPGGMTMPYPDLRHYSLRDYGNRVGIYRFLEAFDRYAITPTIAMNSRLTERYPQLVEAICAREYEIISHGLNMDELHYGGMDPDYEQELVSSSLSSLRRLTGQPIKGWLSPAKSQSYNTPDILKKAGIEYICDWVNDELPYPFETTSGPIMAMPLSTELEDRYVIMNNLHSEESWLQQVKDACDFLMEESNHQGGRLLSLSIHPWLLGQPHRIAKLEAALDYLTNQSEIWSASATDILEAYHQSNACTATL